RARPRLPWTASPAPQPPTVTTPTAAHHKRLNRSVAPRWSHASRKPRRRERGSEGGTARRAVRERRDDGARKRSARLALVEWLALRLLAGSAIPFPLRSLAPGPASGVGAPPSRPDLAP